MTFENAAVAATVTAFLCYLSLSISAKIASFGDYKRWISELTQQQMLRWFLIFGPVAIELATAVALIVSWTVRPALVLIFCFSALFGFAQLALWLKNIRCKCMGMLDRRLASYPIAIFFVASLLLIVCLPDSEPINVSTILATNTRALCIGAALIAGLGAASRRRDETQSIFARPPQPAAEGDLPTAPIICGFGPSGAALNFDDGTDLAPVTVVAFLGSDCGACERVAYDIRQLSRTHRKLVRFLICVDDESNATLERYDFGDATLVRKWKEYFPFKVAGYPGAIAFETSSRRALSKVIYSVEKVRLVLAMALNRAESALLAQNG